jgi:hypothetical protein
MGGPLELDYPDGLRVERGLTESALLAWPQASQLTKRDMGTGWAYYALPDLRDGNERLRVELQFHDGLLSGVFLYPRLPGDDPDDPWRGWSEAREHERARKVEAWLRARGCAPGQYSWGTVSADFDAKTGAGDGFVRFAP